MISIYYIIKIKFPAIVVEWKKIKHIIIVS